MKKTVKLQNLDCAHCAMKMEDALRKIDGVKSVSVSFIMQRMTIEADDDCFDKIIEQAKKVCKKVFSVLDIIQKLEVIVPDDNFVFLGEADFLVEYQPGTKPGKFFTNLKISVICILIFFGAAFTIMAFNNDISIDGVFEHFYYQMTGRQKPQFSELEIAYSVGLAAGIIVFFNHFGNRRLTDDVTPIEVEINKHQQDTYDTIIENTKQKSQN